MSVTLTCLIPFPAPDSFVLGSWWSLKHHSFCPLMEPTIHSFNQKTSTQQYIAPHSLLVLSESFSLNWSNSRAHMFHTCLPNTSPESMHTQQQGHCLMWETWKVYQRLFLLLVIFFLQKKILDPISSYAWFNNHISTTSLKVSIASMDFSLPSAAHSYFYRYCNFPFRLSKSSVKYLQNVCLPRVFH